LGGLASTTLLRESSGAFLDLGHRDRRLFEASFNRFGPVFAHELGGSVSGAGASAALLIESDGAHGIHDLSVRFSGVAIRGTPGSVTADENLGEVERLDAS